MKTRHGDKKREIMWDSSKPSSTEIVPVLTERNAHSIFTTNCSFCLLRFSHVLYSTHEKYISLALEQQKQQNHSITTSLLFFSCQFNDVCAKLKIWHLDAHAISPTLESFSQTLSICTSPETHTHFIQLYTLEDFSKYQFKR